MDYRRIAKNLQWAFLRSLMKWAFWRPGRDRWLSSDIYFLLLIKTHADLQVHSVPIHKYLLCISESPHYPLHPSHLPCFSSTMLALRLFWIPTPLFSIILFLVLTIFSPTFLAPGMSNLLLFLSALDSYRCLWMLFLLRTIKIPLLIKQPSQCFSFYSSLAYRHVLGICKTVPNYIVFKLVLHLLVVFL